MITEYEWKRVSMQNNEFEFKELPITLFHEYYLEKGGMVTDLKLFSEVFFLMVNNGPILLKKSNKVINYSYEAAVHGLFHYYNTKFKIGDYEQVS